MALQENAELRDTIALAQQQLHEAAAAAASKVLSEQALTGQQQALQQAHLLVQPMFLVLPTTHACKPAMVCCTWLL